MGFKVLDLKMPTDFTREELKRRISKKLRIKGFTFNIEKQGLDARKKTNIQWTLRVAVSSPALPGTNPDNKEHFFIPSKKREKRVIVVGSGPAGFFAAYTLLKAGFDVTILEQGKEVGKRFKDILHFEESGELDESSNYAFGEGGAGTFSDGKLTSRTKSISRERKFIFDTYIEAGAPSEIAYLSHPHLGSDHLRKIVKNLRKLFTGTGGTILFGARVTDIHIKDGKVTAVETDQGKHEAHYFIFAAGHSSYDTYGLLIKRGVPFEAKSFALGCRVEHRQEIINLAQWGREKLPGVKAAEYRLTFKEEGRLPVYTFCMCPGGTVVPATAYRGANIVNGKSDYKRDALFANAAVVVGIRPDELMDIPEGQKGALEILDWLRRLEESFYTYAGGYRGPACRVGDFLKGEVSADFPGSSYPFGLVPVDFRELLPEIIHKSMERGVKNFCKRIKGFEDGVLMGLESKTSAPVRALREPSGKSVRLDNLYISGEGSGYAGGIVSSAADGIKAAVDIIYTG